MKSYLRYEPSIKAGVIASSSCNVIYDKTGHVAITGAAEEINLFHIRQATQIGCLLAPAPNYPHILAGEVQILCKSNGDGSVLAAGYSTGDIRIFDYEEKILITTLRGHRSAVTSLTFGESGKCLASGSADCDIILWDMISHTGISRLRGHKDAITGVIFYQRHTQQLLISSSKDALLKVWDLATNYCIQTVVGHRSEIWSMVLVTIPLNNSFSSESTASSSSSSTEVRLWTGCSDEYIRAYRIISNFSSNLNPKLTGSTSIQPSDNTNYDIANDTSSNKDSSSSSSLLLGDDEKVLEFYGSIKRSDKDRCTCLQIDSSGSILAVTSTGKAIEFFKIRTMDEIKKKYKRRLKRRREKNAMIESNKQSSEQNNLSNNKTKPSVFSAWDESSSIAIKDSISHMNDDGNNDENHPMDSYHSVDIEKVILSDEIEEFTTLRCSSKVRGFAFTPILPQVDKMGNNVTKALVSFLDNSFSVYDITIPSKTIDNTTISSMVSSVELQGHRNDIRAITISEDGLQIATCGNDGIKIWNSKNLAHIRSCRDAGFGMSILFTPGSRYVVMGTKDGHIQIVDTTSSVLVFDELAHEGTIWSLTLHPAGKGFASGGADKVVRFWDFIVGGSGNENGEEKGVEKISGGSLAATVTRELQMTHDILSVRYSHTTKVDKLMIAIGLLDNTVKVFYDDSLKFFLSLYGHKLPVMTCDFSYDNKLVISGSVDKTIKIWGTDFGDCHRSLIAHSDSITCVRFQPDTHYFFSCSKDGLVKYWDADRFEQILVLPGHIGSIWGCEISYDGSICVSVGQDRSIRMWERSEDMVFIEEEKDREIEAQVDKAIRQQNKDLLAQAEESMVMGTTAIVMKTSESVKGGEALMEALDLVEEEIGEIIQWHQQGHLKERKPNMKLLGLSPYHYFLRTLRQIKAPDMEQALLILPFHYVSRFISMLLKVAKQGYEMELCARCCTLLLRCHQQQIITTRSLLDEIFGLQELLLAGISSYRLLLGTNLAGLKVVHQLAVERASRGFGSLEETESLTTKDINRPRNKSTGKRTISMDKNRVAKKTHR